MVDMFRIMLYCCVRWFKVTDREVWVSVFTAIMQAGVNASIPTSYEIGEKSVTLYEFAQSSADDAVRDCPVEKLNRNYRKRF